MELPRAEITRQMERILLQDIPDDRGFYWQSAMGYWNRVQHWPPLQGTTVFNFGKFEQVWCRPLHITRWPARRMARRDCLELCRV